MSKETVRNTVTFPIKLYEKIKQMAEADHRSVSQQIIYLCEVAIAKLEDK